MDCCSMSLTATHWLVQLCVGELRAHPLKALGRCNFYFGGLPSRRSRSSTSSSWSTGREVQCNGPRVWAAGTLRYWAPLSDSWETTQCQEWTWLGHLQGMSSNGCILSWLPVGFIPKRTESSFGSTFFAFPLLSLAFSCLLPSSLSFTLSLPFFSPALSSLLCPFPPLLGPCLLMYGS